MKLEHISGKDEDVKPDILIPFTLSGKELADSSISVIYVRPETNKVTYEAAIIQSIKPYADIVYLASLSGLFVNRAGITLRHYFNQLQFATNGKAQMAEYPEMVQRFEEKFETRFVDAPVIGSFEALIKYEIKRNADELFATMVPEADFLEMYGHTIKKINSYYVLNYDMPAIITRHHDNTAVFIIAVRLGNKKHRFSGIHHLIYRNMCKNKDTSIAEPGERLHLPWYDRVKRTYHISRSHIEAMFDLTDYVFKTGDQCLDFADTPLGQVILQRGIIEPDRLEERLTFLKENPLVYLRQENGSLELANIIMEGKTKRGPSFVEKNLQECAEIIGRIAW